MRPIIFIFAIFSSIGLHAQTTAKNEVYSKIESSYAWLNYKMLDRFAKINLTEEQWNWVLKNEHYGLSSVNGLGNDLANYYELTSDNRIGSDCKYKETPDCLERIENMSPKVYVEMNGANTKMLDTNLKLAFHALSTIGGFLGTENLYGTKAGWKPRGDKVTFVLNIDNGTAQPQVTWNNDGSVVTITMFVGTESPDWRANMLDALNRGK